MNKNRVAKGLNEPPVPFWPWTTMGRTDIEGMKELSPIKVRIEDVVVVRGFLFMRRENGRASVGKFRVRREGQLLHFIEAAAIVADDAEIAGGVAEGVEVATARRSRRVARGHGSPRRSDSGQGRGKKSRG